MCRSTIVLPLIFLHNANDREYTTDSMFYEDCQQWVGVFSLSRQPHVGATESDERERFVWCGIIDGTATENNKRVWFCLMWNNSLVHIKQKQITKTNSLVSFMLEQRNLTRESWLMWNSFTCFWFCCCSGFFQSNKNNDDDDDDDEVEEFNEDLIKRKLNIHQTISEEKEWTRVRY